MYYRKIEEQLFNINTTIENALANPEILAALAQCGCTKSHLEAARANYQAALTAHQALRSANAHQGETLKHFHKSWAQARKLYVRHLRVARRIFRTDTDATRGMLLKGTRKQSYAGWFDQATQFYKHLLASPKLIDAMTQRGLSQAHITNAQQWVLTTRDARLAYKNTYGDYRHAVQQRSETLKELLEWYGTFRIIVAGALAETPELLAKLVIRPLEPKLEDPLPSQTQSTPSVLYNGR